MQVANAVVHTHSRDTAGYSWLQSSYLRCSELVGLLVVLLQHAAAGWLWVTDMPAGYMVAKDIGAGASMVCNGCWDS